MSKKKDSSINKKTVRSSLHAAAAVHKAFLRELDQTIPLNHPGQISLEGLLFPTFEEVRS